MKVDSSQNKKHWDTVGGSYGNIWRSNYARISQSNKEMTFIAKYLPDKEGQNILDIGVGSGRIIENYLKYFNKHHLKESIYGVDISNSMVSFCKKRFSNEKDVSIEKCDVSTENIVFHNRFNFISAIRVLKYNKNWSEIISKIHNQMEDGGIFVFSMINKYSLDCFVSYPVEIYKTNYRQIVDILNSTGFEVIEIRGFSRIQDVFYRAPSNNKYFARLVIFAEKILSLIFGSKLFNRVLFIVCKKK